MERDKLKGLLFQNGDTQPQHNDDEFQACVSMILDRANGLTNFEMLQLYGLYKQVTEGNVDDGLKPSSAGNSVAAAKWYVDIFWTNLLPSQ